LALDRCHECDGISSDQGEIEAMVRKTAAVHWAVGSICWRQKRDCEELDLDQQ
jgi:hypothetical protein